MSGVEAIAVLGLISSIIAIVDGTKQVYDAATNARGLPEAFREVSDRLPIVTNILSSAKQDFDQGQVDEGSCRGVKPIVGACEKKAKKLNELFIKAIPADSASDIKQYYKAVKACGQGNEVEKLMKGMLEDVQLLACEHGMKTATKAQQEQIVKAIAEVSDVSSSVPEDVFQESGITANNSGTGTQYVARGEFIAQGEARQYNSSGGPMHFDVHYGSSMSRSSDAKVTSQSLPCASPAFFGRELELKAIQDCFLSKDPGQKAVVLTGIGGLGKTQIALQFWTTHASSYSSRIWIDASSLATVLSSFREIAQALGHNVASASNDTASRQPMMAIKSWLALADNNKWLLVIDNVEDLDCDYSLHDMIPKCDHGAILVTTTQSETARILGALNIEIGMIGKDAGAAILRHRFKRKTYTDEEKKLTENVVEALHGVPLAIEQAGAYLQFNPSLTRTVLKGFLTKLSSPSTQVDILARIPKRSMWFYEKHRSVIDTFSLMKAYLARHNDDAINVLLISAFLAQGEIPLSFLTKPITGGEASSTVARTRAIYEESQEAPSEALVWLRRITADDTLYYIALDTLEQFCCIKRRLAQDERTYVGYSMHNVIRHWCQKTLKSEEQAEWSILAAFQLSQCLQLDTVSIFSHRNYSRHAGHMNSILLDTKCGSLVRYPDGPYWWQAFATAYVWARFYQRQRRFDLARRIIKIIIFYEKSAYDPQWPSQRESLETLHLQARVLWEQGDFPKAIPRYRELLEASETHLGHFDDLTTQALRELRNVQDRSKRHQRDWQNASCIANSHSLSHREEDHTSRSGESSALEHFLLRYSDPSMTNSLHDAALSGHEEDVKRLILDGEVDIEARDEHGRAALHCAAFEGHKAIVQLLLDIGADIEAKEKLGGTALHYAASEGHTDIVQLLLEMGADIEAKNHRDETALHYVAVEGHEAIARLLLDKGADTEAKDNSGSTALDFCKGDTAIEELLRKTISTREANRISRLSRILPEILRNPPAHYQEPLT